METEDAGVYTCVARNSEGEATCDIPLVVNGKFDLWSSSLWYKDVWSFCQK